MGHKHVVVSGVEDDAHARSRGVRSEFVKECLRSIIFGYLGLLRLIYSVEDSLTLDLRKEQRISKLELRLDKNELTWVPRRKCIDEWIGDAVLPVLARGSVQSTTRARICEVIN